MASFLLPFGQACLWTSEYSLQMRFGPSASLSALSRCRWPRARRLHARLSLTRPRLLFMCIGTTCLSERRGRRGWCRGRTGKRGRSGGDGREGKIEAHPALVKGAIDVAKWADLQAVLPEEEREEQGRLNETCLRNVCFCLFHDFSSMFPPPSPRRGLLSQVAAWAPKEALVQQ